MKPSQIKSVISACFKANVMRPFYIESSPGLGKTELGSQIAKELNIGFKVNHGPLLQPEDYGFPVINSGRDDVSFIVSKEKFPLDGTDCPDSGILLFDELPQADSNCQKILTNLLESREIHGKRLKPGWLIIATGNRAKDRAGANRLLSHLKNKITTLEMEASLDDWTQWALNNAIQSEVIGFLRFRPDLLSNFDPQAECNATPRSWCKGVSARLGVIPSELEFETFKGEVGEGPSAEFCAFLKIYRKLPSPDAILLNPGKAEIPTDLATLYALCGALASKSTPDNFGRIMTYVTRMPKEFTVLYVNDAAKRNEEITTCVDFIKWAVNDGSKIFS